MTHFTLIIIHAHPIEDPMKMLPKEEITFPNMKCLYQNHGNDVKANVSREHTIIAIRKTGVSVWEDSEEARELRSECVPVAGREAERQHVDSATEHTPTSSSSSFSSSPSSSSPSFWRCPVVTRNYELKSCIRRDFHGRTPRSHMVQRHEASGIYET